MVRYGSLVEGKLSASLLSPFLCISGRRRDQENDDKYINGDLSTREHASTSTSNHIGDDDSYQMMIVVSRAA